MSRTLKLLMAVAISGVAAGATMANPSEAVGDPAPQRMQDRSGGDGVLDFGNSETYYSTVDGYGFIPDNNSMLYEHGFSSGGFYCRSGDTVRRAAGQLLVPHGVRLRIMSVWMHDSTAAGQLTARLRRSCLPDFASGFPSSDNLATVATGVAFNTGDMYDFDNFDASNVVADNQSCTYAVILDFSTSCTSNQQLGAYKVRVRWQRQIPPAPASATFGDLPPSDPAFQSVEALVAAGVTLGCGSGNYCPTLPVTRAQMAQFLARALGLPRATISDPANP